MAYIPPYKGSSYKSDGGSYPSTIQGSSSASSGGSYPTTIKGSSYIVYS